MARIGEMKCWNPACACTDAAVHQTAGGKLSTKCHKCGFEHWGIPGTKGFRDMQAATTLDDGAPAPGPAPEPVPKAKPKASPFSLGALA